MSEPMNSTLSGELAFTCREPVSDVQAEFDAFSQCVFADGALSAKTKQLIAVAVAHVRQCRCCIAGHTNAALHHGATPQELIEAIWVAAEARTALSLAGIAERHEDHEV